MKTVLITAYAVNPFKGSEDGMGWNYIVQAAKQNRIVAVTRRNNKAHIDKYIRENALPQYDNMQFLYFDWPQWLLFWKKGPFLSMIYYYCWQLSLVLWLGKKNIHFDIVHNLNFHNDWTPSFLWMLHQNFVWGPVGHHPLIPRTFIRPYGNRAYIKDRLLWAMKWCFWNLDPFLKITKEKASYTWCMHQDAAGKLRLRNNFFVHPSIAASAVTSQPKTETLFHVLSIGRFVPLKGFDITIRSFAAFLKRLTDAQRQNVKLTLIGKGPCKNVIQQIIRKEKLYDKIELLDWMPQEALSTAYNNASVFLYPSHEGAGMVVAEALRYGTPVVCWNNCGPGTIVHPESDLKVNYAGYIQSIDAFADKLYQLFINREYYKRESLRAIERFNDSLDWNVKEQQLNNLYAQAIQ